MKIAVLLPSLEGRGAERMGLLLAEALIEAGYEVEIPVACKVGALVDHGVARTHVVDLAAPNEILSLPHLLRYLDHSKPDLLIAVIHTAKMMAGCAKKLRPSLRFIISVRHDLKTHPFWLRRWFGYRLERWLYRDVDAVHVIARDIVPQVVEHFGVEQSRVVAIPNPINRGGEARSIEPEHEALFDRPVLITAGHMVAQKNHEALIDAFHRSGLAGDVRLVILGEGPLRCTLERQVVRLGLQQDVAMPGFVRDVRPYMRRSAGFLLSSRSEGLGNVLLEALSCDIPVASFDCPVGPREVLADGRIGRLIPLHDIEGLAKSMCDMISGTLVAAPAELVARQLAGYQLEHVKRRYVELAEMILGSTAASPRA